MEKNLGHATAYGYAKSKGYSGTEEEFAELMADYASVGQSAAQSAEQAAASATSASGSATTASQAAQTATSKASEASSAASTATTKASEASTSADTASTAATSAGTSAQTATTAAATATTKASEASESATTASTAKTDAETARDAAAQSASAAAESARTLTIDATLTQSGQAADAKAVGDKIDVLKSAIKNGYVDNPPVSNGSFSVSGTYVTNNKRIRTDFIPVKIGDKIAIDNGSLKHACGAWNGTLSNATNIRNDSTFDTQDETIISKVDGYYIVVFAKQDATQTISPSDFDGSIHLYSNEIYRNTERINRATNKFDFVPALTADDVVEDYYINGTNGQTVSGSSYVCTGFVPIDPGAIGLKLTANCYYGSIIGWAFYSAKNTNAFISGGAEGGWAQKTIIATIPSTAKYFRTTIQKTAYSSPSDFGISYQIMIDELKNGIDTLKTDVAGIHSGLTEDETAIRKNTSALRKNPTWANGTIQGTGAIDSRTDRINTGLMIADVTSIKCINDYYGLIAYYDADKVFISITSFSKNFSVDKSSFPSGTVYIAVAMHNNTGSIDPSEGSNCVILYSVDAVANGTFDLTSQSTPFIEGSKNQIARLGWDVYNATNPPEQTSQSYALAYKNGCRIMLADVRVTGDGKFVLWHDETLNNNVRHTDGTALSDAEKAITISGSTLSELNAFDYGIYRGIKYAGMKIPMLEDFLKWCSLANCVPMLEVKVQLTEANCIAIANMLKQYGLGDRVIIDEYYTYLQNTVGYWKTNLPKCTLCIIAWVNVSTAQSFISTNLANTDIQVLLTISGTDQLSLISTSGAIDYDKVKTVTNLGAKLTYTEVTSLSGLGDLYEDGYLDVFSYVASSKVHVNAWLANELGLN